MGMIMASTKKNESSGVKKWGKKGLGEAKMDISAMLGTLS
jgi:hypothetical protein